MPLYQVQASERVHYVLQVRARNKKEAFDKVLSGEIDLPDADDSSDYSVDSVELKSKK